MELVAGGRMSGAHLRDGSVREAGALGERSGWGRRGSVTMKGADECLLSSCGAVSALVEVEMEVEGGRGVLSDEQSGGAPRAQRRVQDAHCTTKWPHNGRQLGMATRCGTHHTFV